METVIFCCTETVLHSIETFQVGTCFCTGDNIISRNHVFHGFDREEFYFCSQFFQRIKNTHKRCFYFRIKSLCQIFFRNSEFHPLDISCQFFGELKIFSFHGCAVFCIMSCNDLQKSCTVRYVFSYRTDLIQGRCISYKTVTGYCSIGWFNSGYTTVGTWLTDRSACI